MALSLIYTDKATFARNSKAIGLLWALFTVCYGIIGTTAFSTPEWIGIDDHAFSGRIGLWSVCDMVESNGEVCVGKLQNFRSFPGRAFQAATVFVGLGVLSAVLTFCAMLFFLCCHPSTVFFTCGWMQLFSAISMMSGCLTHPLGWKGINVQRICVTSDIFYIGKCELRWGYLLAVIASMDAFILCILAFTLATRYSNSSSDSSTSYDDHAGYSGETISVAGSRKSLNLRPILSIHPDGQDAYCSHFSSIPLQPAVNYHGHLPYSAHNFEN